MTTQTHSTSSTASQSKFERRREALAIYKAEVDAANKAHRAALHAANEKYLATLAALNGECCHPNAELVDQWLDSDGTADLHTVYEFECPHCGTRWIDDKVTY